MLEPLSGDVTFTTGVVAEAITADPTRNTIAFNLCKYTFGPPSELLD
jgi:hypothetical protein